MIEQIVIWGIILVCALYVGKRFIAQLKSAGNKDSQLDCGSGCSGCCSESQCSEEDQQ